MSYSEGNSYEEILARCLSDPRLTNIDKRVGSIIYDSLAPLCMELAEAYIKMDIMDIQTYLGTATGKNLDNRVYDNGLFRREATKAEVQGIFKKYQVDGNGNYVIVDGQRVLVDMDVPVGSRFTVPNNPNLTYIFKEKRNINDSIVNVLECEIEGSSGSSYSGTILPITPILNLVKAQIGQVITYGLDTETDDDLRARAIEYVNNVAFGGNIEDYRNRIGVLSGVGAVKVFPAYINPNQLVVSILPEEGEEMTPTLIANIGAAIRAVEGVGTLRELDFDGSVNISVLNQNYSPMDDTAIAVIQNEVDPRNIYKNVGAGNGNYIYDPVNDVYIEVEQGEGNFILIPASGNGYGIAPIGHRVLIMTPTEDTVNVQLVASVKATTTIEDQIPFITKAISDYIDDVRSGFSQYSVLEVKVSSIIAAIITSCPDVTNVTNVTIGSTEYGSTTDKVTYEDTAEQQFIPKLGSVSVTEG